MCDGYTEHHENNMSLADCSLYLSLRNFFSVAHIRYATSAFLEPNRWCFRIHCSVDVIKVVTVGGTL